MTENVKGSFLGVSPYKGLSFLEKTKAKIAASTKISIIEAPIVELTSYLSSEERSNTNTVSVKVSEMPTSFV